MGFIEIDFITFIITERNVIYSDTDSERRNFILEIFRIFRFYLRQLNLK